MPKPKKKSTLVPEALCGNRWTEKTARRMIPLLVWCAQNGKKITYNQLDKEIQRRRWGHHVHVAAYGRPAGAIADALIETGSLWKATIPPLNALVVTARTGIPGDGCDYYLEHYLHKNVRNPTDSQREAMAEETMNKVWAFDKWDEILKGYGLGKIEDNIPCLLRRTNKRKPRKRGWSSGPESKEHRLLKEWVAKNPQILNDDIRFRNGKVEYLFASADRADVMFSHKRGWMAVEVKANNANDADLERGIYQCVKYQALLRAELSVNGEIPNGRSVLVSERKLSEELQSLADFLGVRVVVG